MVDDAFGMASFRLYPHELAEPYIPRAPSAAELIQFEYRLSALIWLRRVTAAAVTAEDTRLREAYRTGTHRVPGWEGESDSQLQDALLVLAHDIEPVSIGAILAACCAALESLFTDLLRAPSARGLRAKARALAALWPNPDEAKLIADHIEWLAVRRNSFAHRLIDEGDLWDEDPKAQRHTFDDDTLEETFHLCGEIAVILDCGYQAFLHRRDSQA